MKHSAVRLVILFAIWLPVVFGDRSHADAATASQRQSCSNSELVEVFPGYPGFNGYLTGVRGQGRYACPEDLEAADPSFSRTQVDADNRAAASRLGIAGTMETWTWENWMAIEASRDMVPTCWSCAILNDDPSQPMPPAGLYDPDDPRLLIGDVYGGSIILSSIG